MTAVPALRPFTTPSLTDATDTSEEVHVSDLSVADSGVKVTASVISSPLFMSAAALSKAIDSGISVTVTWHFASRPLCVVATTSQLPPPTAVTVPSSATVATATLEEDQLTVASVTSAGSTFAKSLTVSPFSKDKDCLLIIIPVAG